MEFAKHMTAKAAVISVHDGGNGYELGDLVEFRKIFHGCLARRADALFELTDAVLCAAEPVHSLVRLSLAPEHRRGHGALYDAINSGRVDFDRVRLGLAGLVLPRDSRGGLLLAVDVSPWPRPDATRAPDRAFCHVRGHGGAAQSVPGWPYSIIVALEVGRTSWVAPLDAVRLRPDDDVTKVTAVQLRELVARLITAGAWKPGDQPIRVAFDSGYDIVRLTYLLADLPVVLIGRVKSNRRFHLPVQAPPTGRNGRRAKHGPLLDLDKPDTHPTYGVSTITRETRYGTVFTSSWDRVHQPLQRRSGWVDHVGDLPVVEGTLVWVQVDRLPGDRDPDPLWIWSSETGLGPEEIDRVWRHYLRRFDIEHMFRMWKQTLGWTKPHVRDPGAADRWTWLIIIAYTQLRLARELVEDPRHPWERKPPKPGRLSPARVRRGFPHIRATLPCLTRVPKLSRPGPGRPPGVRNRQVAPRPPVGKSKTGATTQSAEQPKKP